MPRWIVLIESLNVIRDQSGVRSETKDHFHTNLVPIQGKALGVPGPGMRVAEVRIMRVTRPGSAREHLPLSVHDEKLSVQPLVVQRPIGIDQDRWIKDNHQLKSEDRLAGSGKKMDFRTKE